MSRTARRQVSSMKSGVRVIEFVETPKKLKEKENEINLQLSQKFPGVGPVTLLRSQDGEIGMRMTMTVGPGKKGLLDQVYRFVMGQLGVAKGRKPGEKKIQAKYHIPEELHRRIQSEAKKSHTTASELVVLCLKQRFS